MKFIQKLITFFLFFAFVVSIYLLIYRGIWQNLYIYTNSDLLYIPSLVKDFWEGFYDWRLWVLTPAPYLFPDIIIFLFISYFTSNLYLSFFIYGLVFALSLIYTVVSLIQMNQAHVSTIDIYKAAIYYFTLFFSILAFFPEDIGLFLFPSYHTSSILFSLFLYVILLKTRTRIRIFLFIIISTLAVLSDKQILYTFYFPFLIASFSLKSKINNKIHWKCLLFFLMSLVFSSLILKLLSAFDIFQIPSIPIMAELKKNILQMKVIANTKHILPELQLFFYDYYLKKLILFLTLLISVGLNIYYSIEKFESRIDIRLFSRFVLLIYFFSILSQMFFGVWGGFRYLWALFFFPYFSIFYYAWNYQKRILTDQGLSAVRAWQRLYVLEGIDQSSFLGFRYIISFILICIAWFFLFQKESIKIEYNNPYPPFVSCLDSLKLKYNLTNGISDYWNAKHIRYLSHEQLIVNQVFTNLGKYNWIHNRDWYNKDKEGEKIIYNFVIPERLDKAQIPKRFGTPMVTEQCEGKEIYIYEKGFIF